MRYSPLLLPMVAIGVAVSGLSPTAWARSEEEIASQSRVVLQQIMASPNQGIPQQLFSNAQAVAIFPQVKSGAFVVGVRKGRGVLVARDGAGMWQAPQFLEIAGGSVGWQAGIQSTDVILVFRSRESLANLMRGKLTIGADASVAAGPLGRQVSAATDINLQAEIYSYSRSRGAFLGVSIDGSVLSPDPAADARFYQNHTVVPTSAVQLVGQISAYAGSSEVVPTSLVTPQATAPQANDSHQQQLTAAWEQLAPLLDHNWQEFLNPFDASDRPEKVVSSLERYETIAAITQYAALTNRPEFQQVLGLLRTIQSSNAPPIQGQLVLPPPPGGPQMPR